jgi:EAL domain-containing protein (putative c-di-GMP-specific phosphodiesterase class I)
MKKTLPEEVRAALEDTALAPRHLQLEVPEAHVTSDVPRSLDMLHRLKELGVTLVLDRFAVRYSSLGRLSELPIDGVKLDLAFLRGPAPYPEDVSLLTAVTAVAKGLKLRVSAQGVETHEQLALIERLGCTEAQGFLLGRPQPPAVVAELLDGLDGPARAETTR